MNGDREPDNAARFSVDVVVALDAEQFPAVALDDAGERLAGKGCHMTISSTLSVLPDSGGSTSTDKQPSTAS